MAVAHDITPFVTIYNTSDWSKFADPATLPGGNGYGITFSPDGTKLILAGAGTPKMTIYNTSDWSKITDPASIPASVGEGPGCD